MTTPEAGLLNRLTGWVGRLARYHPWKFLIVFLILSGLMVIPVLNMTTETDPNAAFLADDPVVNAQQEIEKVFPGNLAYLSVIKADNVLTKDALLEVDRYVEALRADPVLAEAIDPLDPMGGVWHLGMFLQGSLGENTSLADASQVQFETALADVLSSPQSQAFVSRDFDNTTLGSGAEPTAGYAIIMIRLDGELFKTQGGPGGGDIDQVDRALVRVSRDFDSDVIETLPLAGFAEEFEDGAAQGVILLPIAALVILVIIGIVLRRVVDVIVVGLSIPLVYLWMFGIMTLLGIESNTLAMFAPIMVLALGIDYAIIVLHRYHEEQEKGATSGEALQIATTWTGGVVFLSALTTMVAFASNMFSSIPGLVDFGFIVAIGILSAFLVMGTIVPAVVYLIDTIRDRRRGLVHSADGHGGTGDVGESESDVGPVDQPRPPQRRAWLSGLLAPLHRLPWVTFLVLALLAGASVYGILNLDTTFDIADFMGDDSPLLESIRILETEFTSQGFESISVLTHVGITTPGYLAWEETMFKEVGDDRGVVTLSDGSVSGSYLTSYVRTALADTDFINSSGVQVGDDGLPATEADVLLVYDHLMTNGTTGVALSEVEKVLVRQDGTYTHARIIIDTQAQGSEIEGLRDDTLASLAATETSDRDTLVTGGSFTFLVMQEEISTSMTRSIFITLGVCFLILLVVFRSVRQALFGIIPVSLAALFLFGTMSLLGYSLNMLTIMLAAISIGVGIDYSINFTQRYREEVVRSQDTTIARERTIETSGKALLGAGASSGFGFAVLLFADLFMFRIFGTLIALMIAFSYLSTMIVLPILLGWFWKRKLDNQKSNQPSTSTQDEAIV